MRSLLEGIRTLVQDSHETNTPLSSSPQVLLPPLKDRARLKQEKIREGEAERLALEEISRALPITQRQLMRTTHLSQNQTFQTSLRPKGL